LSDDAIAATKQRHNLCFTRRLVATSRDAVAPSYLRSRVLHDVPLPRVSLSPAGADGIEEKDRSMLAFLLGMAGPENTGMPRDVFRVVVDFLMPTWDPLRRENTGAALIVPPTK
jgi:hypothetical protein